MKFKKSIMQQRPVSSPDADWFSGPPLSLGLYFMHLPAESVGLFEYWGRCGEKQFAYPVGEFKHSPLALVKGRSADKPWNRTALVTVE